jgi:tetratricopeptide (TPR) repeat protein
LKSFALHSKIHLQTREFHVHTGSVPEKQMVISEIFEKGQFISSQHQPFSARESENKSSEIKYLKSIAHDLHKNIIDEVKMLFVIHERIAPLNKYLAHFKLGSLFYHRNILTEAIINYQRTLDLNNDFISAYVQLGKCYIKQENYDKAIAAFEKGLEIKNDFPDLLNGLGVALTFAKQYDKAAKVLQHTLSIKPDFDEANFNLGVVLFLSTLEGGEVQDKAIVPSRVIRYVKALNNLDRYKGIYWKGSFEMTLQQIADGNLQEILNSLHEIQYKLITHLKIDTLIESFYLRFMYSGQELGYEELESYEKRILSLARQRENFADYWNEMGIIHIIQCRHLFLKSVTEFEKAVELNPNYKEATNNLDLIKNIKKGFLILLRAILK